MKTDGDLKRDAETELKWEPTVTEAHIGVTAKDGVITMTGHVPAHAEKWAAERAAKRVAVSADGRGDQPGRGRRRRLRPGR